MGARTSGAGLEYYSFNSDFLYLGYMFSVLYIFFRSGFRGGLRGLESIPYRGMIKKKQTQSLVCFGTSSKGKKRI